MWNIRKFHRTYRSWGLGKTDSRNKGFAESVGKSFRFPSFNPVFKNTKISYVFGTIRKNAPNNWNKIGYTFGPLKYRPNKRSGKLKIKSQIVRVTIFCVKILLTRGYDSLLLICLFVYHYILYAKHLSWSMFIFQFVVLLWHIQIVGQ